MIRITTPIDRYWAQAAERATLDRKAGNVAERVAPMTYRMRSASKPGEVHTVVLTNVGQLEGVCDCEHARSGGKGHCRHVANALMSEIARVSRKPVPAAPAVPASASAEEVRKAEVERFMARFAR